MVTRIAPWVYLVVVSSVVVVAIFAEFLTPYSPNATNLEERLVPPFTFEGGSQAHILGTDHLGRDILSRLFFGARYSLIVVFGAITLTALLGTVLGLISGYKGGITDSIIMRLTDAALAFPAILFALLLAATIGASFTNLMLALVLPGWAQYARIVRGEVLSIRERDFVAQARTIGCSGWTIMIRHLLPNVVNTVVVIVTLRVGLFIILESSLSFLGVGIPPPTPSWGNMVSDGRQYMASAWWISFMPAMAILLLVLCFNLFGDWLRDHLDPKLRQI